MSDTSPTKNSLMGGQGNGKGVFAEYFGKLFGSHFQHVSNPEHLVGRFNGNLSSFLLVFADEAFWAGDKAKPGALKTLITEPRRMIEMKHKDAAEVDNYVRLIVASNEDWVVPAEADDRRFCVLKVSDARKGDTAYFQNIINERDSVWWCGGTDVFSATQRSVR
ncbi:primase-helicase family protein [Endozoicomonas acroporae]|uniref:primase-helicase family protein n=1 Tax=Endozoicomonas acroporae TaxID=1701104 RepID=UPI0013D1CA4B|nr:primase-helicase family protein [Endozoicomonas acroporae]